MAWIRRPPGGYYLSKRTVPSTVWRGVEGGVPPSDETEVDEEEEEVVVEDGNSLGYDMVWTHWAPEVTRVVCSALPSAEQHPAADAPSAEPDDGGTAVDDVPAPVQPQLLPVIQPRQFLCTLCTPVHLSTALVALSTREGTNRFVLIPPQPITRPLSTTRFNVCVVLNVLVRVMGGDGAMFETPAALELVGLMRAVGRGNDRTPIRLLRAERSLQLATFSRGEARTSVAWSENLVAAETPEATRVSCLRVDLLLPARHGASDVTVVLPADGSCTYAIVYQ